MQTKKSIITLLQKVSYPNGSFIARTCNKGWLMQFAFVAPDSKTGVVGIQKGRKWYLSPHMTDSEVISTCLLAVLTAMEHEVRENFKVGGIPAYGPHVSVYALLRAQETKDVRS